VRSIADILREEVRHLSATLALDLTTSRIEIMLLRFTEHLFWMSQQIDARHIQHMLQQALDFDAGGG